MKNKIFKILYQVHCLGLILLISGCYLRTDLVQDDDPNKATALSFIQQPTSEVAGVVFSKTPKVEIQNSNGERVTSGTDSTKIVTLKLTSGSGTLTASSGSVSVAAVAGVATFTGFSIDIPGSNKKLQASSGTLTAGETSAFVIAAGTVTVSPVYPNNNNWMNYVKFDEPAKAKWKQDDTACVVGDAGSSLNPCVHGAEYKTFDTTLSSCTGLTITDSLGAFDWTCDDAVNPVKIYSTGLKDGKGLIDLITATEFKDNAVDVKKSGTTIYSSSPAKWWTNAFATLPAAGFFGTAGTIYTVAANRTTTGLFINSNRIAVVPLSGVTLTKASGDNCIIYTGSYSFLWFEGQYDGASLNFYGIASGAGAFMQFRNVLMQNVPYNGINLDGSKNNWFNGVISSNNKIGTYLVNSASYNQFINLTTNSNSNYGLFVDANSNYNSFKTVTSSSNTFHGILISASTNNTLDTVTANSNQMVGISVADGGYNSLKNLTVNSNTQSGIYFQTSHNNSITNALIKGNGNNGIYANQSNYLSLKDVVTFENDSGVNLAQSNYARVVNYQASQNNKGTGAGLIVNNSSNGVFHNLNLHNNLYSGLHVLGSSTNNNTFTKLSSTNSENGFSGLFLLGDAHNQTFHQINVSNNKTHGIYLARDFSGPTDPYNITISHALTMNNLADGLDVSYGYNSKFAQIVSYGNDVGIAIRGSASNLEFYGNYLAGSNAAANCYVEGTVGANPGLVSMTCANQGSSMITYRSGLNMSSSLVGKVTTTDSVNASNTNGTKAFASITDWINFESFFRTWGKDGGAFPAADNRDRCSSGTCRIWDWRVRTGDTILRNTSNDGLTQNSAFTSGAACPAAVQGDYSIRDQQNQVYLLNALEIMDDGIGNDNGLCESNEACIYSPNFGWYQGEGDHVAGGTCTFSNGVGASPVTGVSMYAYPTNGN